MGSSGVTRFVPGDRLNEGLEVPDGKVEESLGKAFHGLKDDGHFKVDL